MTASASRRPTDNPPAAPLVQPPAQEERVARAEPAALAGPPATLRLGMWVAWGLVALYLAYAAAVAASGAARGTPRDPAWAIAEVLTLAGAPLQVLLFAALHASAPQRARLFSLLALGWMLVMAALTATVHFVELTVARRIDLAAQSALAPIFELGRPSLLLGVELAAWHLFFGLALLSAAAAVRGRGLEAAVRTGLLVGGALCLAGLLGPALDKPALRLIGVAGYAVVFPIVCAMLGVVFKHVAQGEQRERPE